MKKPFKLNNRRRDVIIVWIAAIAIIVLCIMWPKWSDCQVRIQGGFGLHMNNGPHMAGQFTGGYQFGTSELIRWEVQQDNHVIPFSSGYFAARMYSGLTFGPVFNLSPEMQIRAYAGVYRRKTGNKHSLDRYVKDGDTTVLYSGLTTNGWNGAAGAQVYWNHFALTFGTAPDKDNINFFITATWHLFKRNEN